MEKGLKFQNTHFHIKREFYLTKAINEEEYRRQSLIILKQDETFQLNRRGTMGRMRLRRPTMMSNSNENRIFHKDNLLKV